MNVYSLFDVKLNEYGPLVLANNDMAVCRALLDGIPGSGSMIAKYPGDFNLICVGSFDMESGELKGFVPHFVYSVADILRPVGGSDAERPGA